MSTRQAFDEAAWGKVWDLMDLPREEYANEEDAWVAGFTGWSSEIKARVPEYLNLYDALNLTDQEKIYWMTLTFDMLHHDRVSDSSAAWQRMATILRRDIDLHFLLISEWVRTTKSTLTNDGWLPPQELNPQLARLVEEFKSSFRWTGEQFDRVI